MFSKYQVTDDCCLSSKLCVNFFVAAVDHVLPALRYDRDVGYTRYDLSEILNSVMQAVFFLRVDLPGVFEGLLRQPLIGGAILFEQLDESPLQQLINRLVDLLRSAATIPDLLNE